MEFAAVFSSPLRRARRTAELAGFPQPTLNDRLAEYDYGEYEGLTTGEIRAAYPGWELYRDGCPGGESPGQVYRRAGAFLSEVAGIEGAVLIFSHGHLLRAMAAAFLEQDVRLAGRLGLDVASISVLRRLGLGIGASSARHRVESDRFLRVWNST
jgi:probable phosphoglycerate mutase